MSCIFRDPDGKLILMCKGADSVIAERLSQESLQSQAYLATKKYVDAYASGGLRTLYLAQKELDEEFFMEWREEAKLSKLQIKDREEKVAAVDEKIEQNLELIGSTAIEDRLQDEVPDTIQFMKSAGIKVWVLTGDKVETAMNIGVAAGLLDSQMELHMIDEGLIGEGLQGFLD